MLASDYQTVFSRDHVTYGSIHVCSVGLLLQLASSLTNHQCSSSSPSLFSDACLLLLLLVLPLPLFFHSFFLSLLGAVNAKWLHIYFALKKELMSTRIVRTRESENDGCSTTGNGALLLVSITIFICKLKQQGDGDEQLGDTIHTKLKQPVAQRLDPYCSGSLDI